MAPNAPIDILRFIDQIDCSVWAATHSEDVILDSIGACFTSKSAIVWYKALENSKQPEKLNINDIRRALLRDFGVENWEMIMARYEPSTGSERYGGDSYFPGGREGCEYYQTQEFKLRLSYLDEIEGLKDQIKFRNRRALEDVKRMGEMKRAWESVVSKKNRTIEQLETMAREFEEETGNLISDPEGKTTNRIESEEAFQRFEKSIDKARERLKQDLGIQSPEENMKPCSIPNILPGENGCPSFPPIKAVHWPDNSSLEKLFEIPPPAPSRKRVFIGSPLKPLNKNVKFEQTLPGLAFTSEVAESLECDDLLSDWNKEISLNRCGRSSLSSSLP